MATARFTENETGVEVIVEWFPKWGDDPMMATITYPDGRTFGATDARVSQHFTIVTPQEVVITKAYGGGLFDRPTDSQLKLEGK